MFSPEWLRGLRRRVHANEPELRFPVKRAARIALLEAHFRPTPTVREFCLDDLSWMRAWQPDGLVAPLDIALMLADQKERGLVGLPSLSTAIVVLTTTDDSPLADHHRDLLWYAFGVPVFEQLRDRAGKIIAIECEVHDGLHVCENECSELEDEIVLDPCPCGLETARVRTRITS